MGWIHNGITCTSRHFVQYKTIRPNEKETKNQEIKEREENKRKREEEREQRRKTSQECIYNKRGTCTFGERCKYIHTIKKRRDYENGRCTRQNCRYEHSEKEECAYNKQERCKFGRECRKKHITNRKKIDERIYSRKR